MISENVKKLQLQAKMNIEYRLWMVKILFQAENEGKRKIFIRFGWYGINSVFMELETKPTMKTFNSFFET